MKGNLLKLLIGILGVFVFYWLYKFSLYLADSDLNSLYKFSILKPEFSSDSYNEFVQNYLVTYARAALYSFLYIPIAFLLLFFVFRIKALLAVCSSLVLGIIFIRVDYFQIINVKMPSFRSVTNGSVTNENFYLIINVLICVLIFAAIFLFSHFKLRQNVEKPDKPINWV